MKKGLVLLVFVFLLSFSFVFAQVEGLDLVPGGDFIKEVVDEDGNVKGIEDVKENIDNLRNQNSSYLFREWTKMPYVGPFLQGIEGFFSFFNPVWKYTFGMEFVWSLAFFLHIFLWSLLIFVIYFPTKELFGNKLFGGIGGFILASIAGSTGIITNFVVLLDTYIKNFMTILVIWIMVMLLVLVLYKKFFDTIVEESEEEKKRRAEDIIIATGRSSGRILDAESRRIP